LRFEPVRSGLRWSSLERRVDCGARSRCVAKRMHQRDTIGASPAMADGGVDGGGKPRAIERGPCAANPSMPLENAKLPLGKAESACCIAVSQPLMTESLMTWPLMRTSRLRHQRGDYARSVTSVLRRAG